MLRATAILLLLSFLWQITGKLNTYLLFKLNEDVIARELCENRSKPSKSCQGKCYLKKELKKETEKEQKQTSSTVKDYLETLICLHNISYRAVISESKVTYPQIYFSLHIGQEPAVFHPPAVA